MANYAFGNFGSDNSTGTQAGNTSNYAFKNYGKENSENVFGNSSQKNYVFTTKNRQYTLNQSAIDWIKNRYKNTFGNYYAADDEDQMNRAQGAMPRSFSDSYGNSTVDAQLYSMGLPSSKYLDSYVADYQAWYGNGQVYEPDKATSDYIKSQWQKSWTYKNTSDDLARKAAGKMPTAVEKAYYDKNGNSLSYADEMYLSMGLPPASEIGNYVYMFGDYTGQTNRVNEFYSDVATRVINDLEFKGIKNDDTLYTQDDGTQITGKKLWEQAYHSVIQEDAYSDVRSWVKADSKGKEYDPDPTASYDEEREQFYEWEAKQNDNAEADDPYTIDPSFDDFIKFYDSNAKSIYAQKLASDAVSDVYTDASMTYGDIIDAAHEKQIDAMYAGITNKDAVEELLNARTDTDPAQIINDLAENGVSRRLGRHAKNLLLDKAKTDEEKQAIKDAFESAAFKASVKPAIRIDADSLFLTREERERRNELDDELGDVLKEKDAEMQAAEFDYDKLSSVFESALDFDESGVVSEESVEAAVNALVETGATASFIEKVANGVISANALILGDGIQQRGTSDLFTVVDEAVTKALAADRKVLVDAAREQALAKGVSNFEFDQMLRRMGKEWEGVLSIEDAAHNYFVEVGFENDLEAYGIDAEEYGRLSALEKMQLAESAWGMNAENITSNFALTKDINEEIDKNFGEVLVDYVGGRWLQNIGLGLASGAVSFADLASGALTGSTRDQWEITKTLSQAYQWSASYGKSDQSVWMKGLNFGTTVANELLRMASLNKIGGLIGGGVGKLTQNSKLLGRLTKTAEYADVSSDAVSGAEKIAFGASKYFNRGVANLINGSAAAMSPFIANAMGSYFSEAMASGATRSDATAYALVCGTFEGAVEKLNMDMWASKALGSNSLAKTVLKGGGGFTSASLDRKARMIHMAASALGEFGEESSSYALSYFMQRGTYDKDAQFDFGEMINSGLMGAFIGITGAAMSAGSFNASNIVAEYMDKHGFDSDFFDLMHVAVQVESMPKKQFEQYSESHEWLTLDDYQSVQRDLAGHARQLESAKQNYATAQEKINSEVQLKIDAVEAIRSQIAAAYDGRQQLTPDTANTLGKLMESLRVAESELATERAQAENKLSELQSGYKETTAQHRAAIEKAQAKLDAHNVALYNTFLPDIAALRGMSAAEVQRATATSQLQQSYNRFDTAYRNESFYEGMFDELDSVSDDAAIAYSNLSEADATLAATADVAEQIRAKMRRVRQRNRQAYEAGIAEAQQQMQAQAEQQTQQPTQEQAAEQTQQTQTVVLDDDAITRITNLAQKLGRRVVVEDMEAGTYGHYDGDGVLHIGRTQLAKSGSPEMIVFKHELTHSLETSKRYYNRLVAFVEQYAKDSFKANERFATFEDQYNAFAEDVRHAYAARGQEATDEIVKHEFVASFSEDHLFTDEAAINALVKTNASLGSRILNQIRYWLYKNGIGGTGDKAADDLRQIERLYAMALHNAGVKPSDDVREYMIGSTLGATRAAQSGIDIYKFKGADGFEKFFLSDHFNADGEKDVHINVEELRKEGSLRRISGVPITEVLEHPRLFAIYPELKDVSVRYHPYYGEDVEENTLGAFNFDKNEIVLYPLSMDPSEDITETIMHEIQHAVQYIEASSDFASNLSFGSNIMLARDHLIASAIAGAASDYDGDYVTRDEAIENIADRIRYLNKASKNAKSEIEKIYKADLGEREARATGGTFAEVDLGIESDEYARDVAKKSNKGKAINFSGNAFGNYQTMEFYLENLLDGGLTSLETKAQNGTITDDERVILDAVEDAKDRAMVSRNAPPEVGGGASENALEERVAKNRGDAAQYRKESGEVETGEQVPDAGRDSSSDVQGVRQYGFVTASTGASPVSWDGYFASDADATEFSSGLSWDDAGSQYGVHVQGMNPRVRDVNVPLSTDGDNATSKVLRSVGESAHLSEENVQDFRDAILNDGLGTYIPQSNDTLQNAAYDLIANSGGVSEAHKTFKQAVAAGRVSDRTVAMGMQLLAEASARGDWDAQLDIIADLCVAATEAGRATQAFSMLKKMGAAGSVYYMQKVQDRLNSKYMDEIAGGEMQRFEIPADLMQNLAQAKNNYEIDAATEKISEYLGQNMPLPFAQRLQNWRYFAMLANPTTHMRNLAGNAMMAGARNVKNAIATGIERSFVSEENRTHAVYSKASHRAEVAAAERAVKEHWKDLTASGGKYGIDQEITKHQRKSSIKWLDKAMNANYDLMSKEDNLFLRSTYVDAYTQYLIAQNIDPAAMTQEQKDAAHAVAEKEAREATFRDASRIATWLNSMPNGTAKVLLSGALPFVKTPINVAKRGVEYSPAGLIRGVQMAADIMAKGGESKYTVSQAVDRIASGTAGTALAAIGFWLAKAGILRGTGDEEEEVEKFLTATGDKNYSLSFSVGGKEYAMDASGLAPINIPLFLGVAAYEVMSREAGERASLSDFTALISGITDPMMEMSFLSSLDSALTAYNSADSVGGSLGAVVWNAAKSYGSQFLPTFLARTGDLFDPTQRTTAGDATSPVGAGMDQFGRSLVSKVPAATYALEPKIDVKGQKTVSRSFGEFALDFANAYILPGKITVKNRDAIDRELVDIAVSTGNTGFLPEAATRKYFTYNKQKYTMDASQFTAYQRDLGEQVYASIKNVMARSNWNSLTDEQKASLLEDAKSNAEKAVKEKYLDILGAYDN